MMDGVSGVSRVKVHHEPPTFVCVRGWRGGAIRRILLASRAHVERFGSID